MLLSKECGRERGRWDNVEKAVEDWPVVTASACVKLSVFVDRGEVNVGAVVGEAEGGMYGEGGVVHANDPVEEGLGERWEDLGAPRYDIAFVDSSSQSSRLD